MQKAVCSNRCHSGRNIYVFQTAFVKRVLADAGYAVRDFNARQRPCHVKRRVPNGRKSASLRKSHAAQAFAIVESLYSDRGYAVWNRYARQGIIMREVQC